MASPREVIPIPHIRGWSDTPDTSPYGTAVLAENVEKVPGGWMAPRRGFALHNQTAGALVGELDERVALATSFRGWSGSNVLVMVSQSLTGAYAGQWIISWATPGQSGAVIGFYPTGFVRPGWRPSICSIGNEALIFVPSDPASSFSHPIVCGGPNGYDGPYWLHSTGSANDLSADVGPFFESDTVNRATFAVMHESRVFFAGYPDEPNLVRYSGFDPMLIALTNEINIQQEVTGLASFARMLLIFARDACFVVDFGGQKADQPKPFLREVGCEHHNTICPYINRLAFLSRRGLMSIDQGGNIEHLTATIWPTILQYVDDFANASLVYYPQRNQLWLLLPAANAVFVYSVEFKEWYQFRWDGSDFEAPQLHALGVCENSIGLVPVIGFVSSDGYGTVVTSQSADLFDSFGAVQGDHSFREAWLSHPIMLLGHQTIRILEAIRVILRDHGPEAVLRFFWLTEGQAPTIDLLLTGQYVDKTLASGQTVARFSTDDKATINIAVDFLIAAGTKIMVAVDHLGVTLQYVIQDGFQWDRLAGSNALVAESIRAALLMVVVGVVVTRVNSTLTLDCAAGYTLSYCSAWDESIPFPGFSTGMSANLIPEADDSVFGTATFVANLGELDFATTIFPRGVRRGRWFQWGFCALGPTDFGVRSAEIDTRRQDGRR